MIDRSAIRSPASDADRKYLGAIVRFFLRSPPSEGWSDQEAALFLAIDQAFIAEVRTGMDLPENPPGWDRLEEFWRDSIREFLDDNGGHDVQFELFRVDRDKPAPPPKPAGLAGLRVRVLRLVERRGSLTCGQIAAELGEMVTHVERAVEGDPDTFELGKRSTRDTSRRVSLRGIE